MVARMKLHLEDMGPINEANINIGKITIVGGQNSTGKSTLSKFIYSFLRSNSLNREEIAIKSLSDSISHLSRYISFYLRRRDMERRVRFPYFRFIETPDLDDLIEKYEILKSEFYELEFPEDFHDKVENRFSQIDDLITITAENEIPLYVSIMKSLLQSEFLTSDFNSFIEIKNACKNDSFNFVVDFKNHSWEEKESFRVDGGFILNDVFYVDSIAILNIFDSLRYSETMSVDHFDFLTDNIVVKPKDVSSAIFDDTINEDIISLEKDIKDIIKGKIVFRDSKFIYESENGNPFDMINTASGIKQIGIIQVLLANRKLKDDCFLIIDEPEVNLHPEWQFKLANILTLMSKKLDISIYINTHSPLFIEAMNTFSDYYDVADTTTYHLAQKYDDYTFNIIEIPESNLSKIYEELGKPYFDMDVLRLEKELD